MISKSFSPLYLAERCFSSPGTRLKKRAFNSGQLLNHTDTKYVQYSIMGTGNPLCFFLAPDNWDSLISYLVGIVSEWICFFNQEK